MDRNQAKHPDRRQAAAVAPTRTTVEPDSEHLKNTRIVSSLARSQAVIEFDPTGTILDANNNFLGAMGYRLDEIRGQHHRMFVDPTYANSAAYEQFWEDLRGGTFLSAEFLRFGKGGREVWIQATYNPVVDASGNVDMIIKFATDITQQKLSQKEIQDRSQAVIEFEPDGTIITANELFLSTVGFTLDQIKGKHHAIFMPPGEAETAEYQALWPSLARGDFRQGEFHRVTSRGDDLWLQGAYNPVLDSKGQVIKVMKTVTNITEQVENKSNASRIGNTIAAAVTQMTGAISEISENVTQNADLAKGVESDASKAAEMASELNDNSSTIGQVVNVIQDLAGQTNLLALNATIEAARAGESGRGFAIVANEVKNLATQTNEATAEIRASVEAIQYDVSLVVDAIQGILNGVADVSTNTGTIAAAIEEQSVVMGGINSTADELLALNAMD